MRHMLIVCFYQARLTAGTGGWNAAYVDSLFLPSTADRRYRQMEYRITKIDERNKNKYEDSFFRS